LTTPTALGAPRLNADRRCSEGVLHDSYARCRLLGRIEGQMARLGNILLQRSVRRTPWGLFDHSPSAISPIPMSRAQIICKVTSGCAS
jgi:hypothetical protein